MHQNLFTILFLLVPHQGLQDDSTIDYYVNLISNITKNAATYQWPTNAYEYYSNEKPKSKYKASITFHIRKPRL